jgi:carboxylesterase type B
MFGKDLGPLVPSLYNNKTLIQPVPLCQSRQSKSSVTSWQWQAAMRSAGDSAIFCRARSMLLVAPPNVSKYFYFFTHTPSFSLNMNNLKYMGAFHGSEVPFVFSLPEEVTTPTERILSSAMGCYWTSFATYGNPNQGKCLKEMNLPRWPILDISGNVIEFTGKDVNNTITIVKGLKNKACKIFAKQY